MLLAYFNLIYCWTYNNCWNKSFVKANKTLLYLREQCCWKILAALCIAGINFKLLSQKIPNKREPSLANASSELLAIGCQNHLCALVYTTWFWFLVMKCGRILSIYYLQTHKVSNLYTLPFPNQNWAVPYSALIQVMPLLTLHPWGHRTMWIHILGTSSGSLPSAAPHSHFLLKLLWPALTSPSPATIPNVTKPLPLDYARGNFLLGEASTPVKDGWAFILPPPYASLLREQHLCTRAPSPPPHCPANIHHVSTTLPKQTCGRTMGTGTWGQGWRTKKPQQAESKRNNVWTEARQIRRLKRKVVFLRRKKKKKVPNPGLFGVLFLILYVFNFNISFSLSLLFFLNIHLR